MITCKCNPKFLYVSKETFDKHVNGQAHIDMMMQKLKKDISNSLQKGGWFTATRGK
jgi:hypothetical protein